MGVKHYAPKDVARELNAAGIPSHPKTLRKRCRLPAGDPRRIVTNPEFPGRFLIPETELLRLIGAGKGATA